MREIKFRAWDKKQKWMTEVVCLNMGTWIDIVLVQPKVEKATYNQLTENVELMQYTGLTDKNGKEIYEGDIVEFIGHKNRIITWTPDGRYSGWFASKVNPENNINDHLPVGENSEYNTIEVLGNIYENPELLIKSTI